MRTLRTPLFAALFACATASTFAQVGGPTLGVVPDGGSLRAMNGIASAGAVGGLLAVGTALSTVEVSPTQQFAIGVALGSGTVVKLDLAAVRTGARNSGLSALAGVNASPDRIVYSPNGSAAALWFASAMRIQLIPGLPSAPSVQNSVQNIDASFMGSALTSLAVSDDGQWVAGAWSNGGARVFSASGAVLPLLTDGPVSALTFFHGRSDVALITSDQLVTITDVAGSAVPTVIWSAPAASASASSAPNVIGLALSSDNSRLTVASSAGGIDTFDLNSNTSQYVDCGCAPETLAPLSGSLYRLTGVSSGTVKLYDASTGDIWFLPVTPLQYRRGPISREATPTEAVPTEATPTGAMAKGEPLQ